MIEVCLPYWQANSAPTPTSRGRPEQRPGRRSVKWGGVSAGGSGLSGAVGRSTPRAATRILRATSVITATALLLASSCSWILGTPIPAGIPPPPGDPVPQVNINLKKGQGRPGIKNILVPTDFSKKEDIEREFAWKVAKGLAASLTFLYVLELHGHDSRMVDEMFKQNADWLPQFR